MKNSHALFERFGVELEYMIVDAGTLDVRPIADRLILRAAGKLDGDVPRGAFEWSNELSLHLIELKTGRPARRLAGLDTGFQSEVDHINRMLKRGHARLLPTAMHPWMDPAAESRLWPHSNREIYEAFNRIFNCSGHGWTNLQSAHINLPFRTAGEFRKLHTAIRLLLPLLPALAASSPFVEGRRSDLLDTRLETYRHNCHRLPSLTGRVIPEWIASPAEYQRRILKRIYRDLAPLDPENLLQEEWVNARGAIPRFERNTIEIRVLDIQECPAADLAIVTFVVEILRTLVREELSPEETQAAPGTRALERLFLEVIRHGSATRIDDDRFLRSFGLKSRSGIKVHEFLNYLLEVAAPRKNPWREHIELILNEGNLAERILKLSGARPSRRRLYAVYSQLADCLSRGEPLHA